MKTIFTIILSAFILNISAAEILKNYSVDVDETLHIEKWMIEPANFEMGKSETTTVVDIAVSNPDFSILVEAVSKAGLVDALSSEGPFTVFAPTNDAFHSLFKELGINGVSDLSAEQLTPILTYHVVSGKVMSTDLSNGLVGTLNEGKSISVDLSEGVKINQNSVTAADIKGSNGVIHAIDKVLLPN